MQLWQLRRKIHSSWLVAFASVGIVLGVTSIQYIDQTRFHSFAWLLIGALFCCISFVKQQRLFVPVVIVAGLMIGLWRGSIVGLEVQNYRQLTGSTIKLTGTVSEDPDSDENHSQTLRLGSISLSGQSMSGRVWVSLHSTEDIKRGDRVTVTGKITPGFGSFAATIYQADLLSVTRPQPGDVARQARDWFADKVRLTIHEPQASLGLGFLLGQKRALPTELTEALVVTGLTHVVVASGYNLTILVRLSRRLFIKISKYLATLSASSMIFIFIAVTGASPSMMRAGLVSGLCLAAWYYGRKVHPLVLLPFAAAVTVVINPAYTWNDLGWQLSFAAFAGVMILAPLLQAYFFGQEKPGTFRQIIGETVSATIATLPVLILAFGQFSNVSIVANLLILPFVPLAMLLTFTAGVTVIFLPQVADIIGKPAEIVLAYMTNVIDYFAQVSWAQTTVSITSWMAIGLYALIAVACLYLWRVTKFDLRTTNIVE